MPNAARRNRQFKPVGEILGDLLSQIRRETASDLERLGAGWTHVVGRDAAEHTRPQAIKNGILLVIVASPVWLHQLQFFKDDMIRNINDALGRPLITDIRFRVGQTAR